MSNSALRMDQQHYNGYVVDKSYTVIAEIEDVPMGNIMDFIEMHEGDEIATEGEPAGYRINKVELDE